MTRKLLIILFAVFSIVMVTGSVQADLNLVEGKATGQWYNPARDGEGFYVEVIGEGDNIQLALAMYSYNAQGELVQGLSAGNLCIGEFTATPAQ